MKTLPLFLSLLFSLSADYVFLTTSCDLAGVLLFIAVQYCHRSLIGVPGSIWLRNGLSLSVPLFLLCSLLLAPSQSSEVSAMYMTTQSSLLLAAALCYFSFLLCNFIYAWKHSFHCLPLPFCICLSLLLVCDFHVGLYNLPRFFPNLPDSMLSYCQTAAYRLIWTFYIPSQFIMLCLFFRSLRRT